MGIHLWDDFPALGHVPYYSTGKTVLETWQNNFSAMDDDIENLKTGQALIDGAIVNRHLGGGIVTVDKLDTGGTATNGYVRAYNSTTGKMEWTQQGAVANSGQIRLEDAGSPFAYLGDVVDSSLTINGGLLGVLSYAGYSDGTASLPLATITDIDARGDKALVTKEWADDKHGDIYSTISSQVGTRLNNTADNGMTQTRWIYFGSPSDTEVYLYPAPDGIVNLGYNAQRWSEIYAVGGVINTSDIRRKDYADISDASWLYDLIPIQYTWKDNPGGLRYGFSAQATYDILPDKTANLVRRPDNEEEADWGMQMEMLIAPMLKLIQDQKKMIDDLQKRVQLLETI